jgi:hypothetical protein
MSPALLKSIVQDPKVVLQQAGGRYLYVTEQGAVVITKEGQVVTGWTQREFLAHIKDVLDAAGIQ